MPVSKIGVNALSTGGPYWDAAGNVGIGTSSPSTNLHVYGSTNSQIRLQNASNSHYVGNISGSMEIQSADIIKFLAGGATERARIDTSGQWLVGCTGITGDAPNTAGGTIKQDNGNTKVRVTGNGTAAFQFYSPGGGTGGPVGSVVPNSGSVSYNTTSDYRLKENVQPLTGGLARIAALKPCTYVWKATGEKGEGFIAHELAEVCPDAVTGEKDAVNAEGRPVYQGIDTSFLVATLTAAIQELKAELDSVKAELAALKGA